MVICYVLGCKSRSERKYENITFHSFPKDSTTRNLWIQSTGRGNCWIPNKYAKICSIHFEKKCFKKRTENNILEKFSVPTLHICTDQSLQRCDDSLKCSKSENPVTTGGEMDTEPSQMFIGTSKEKFFFHNTLLCLVNSLKEKNITVDLRNDSYICGQLVNVDGFMNLSFSKAIYCDTCGNEYAFDDLFVHGRNIRYVHIPETESIINNIKNEVERVKVKKVNPNPVKKSLKVKKALKQHMATVAALEK